jgi:hypothetical protein
VEFLEATAFKRAIYDYMDEEGLRELQARLAESPEAGVVIPGTGGFRKVRAEDRRRGKGRRSGLRMVYYHFEEDDQMVTLYDKGEAADLSAEQKKVMKAAIGREKIARRAKRERR